MGRLKFEVEVQLFGQYIPGMLSRALGHNRILRNTPSFGMMKSFWHDDEPVSSRDSDHITPSPE
jgi:hypothetical protein